MWWSDLHMYCERISSIQLIHTPLTSRVCVYYSRSCVHFFVTSWTIAHQAPLSMGFSRREYWSGLPFPSPGDLPDPGIKPASLASPALACSLLSEPPGKPSTHVFLLNFFFVGTLKFYSLGKFQWCNILLSIIVTMLHIISSDLIYLITIIYTLVLITLYFPYASTQGNNFFTFSSYEFNFFKKIWHIRDIMQYCLSLAYFT